MPSHLNQYQLLRTLGQGAFSKVKLALDTDKNKYFALKVHKGDGSFTQAMVDVVQTEARAIRDLNHPGIVNLVDFIPMATVKKADGSENPVVCVIVEELATGGELFFFVKNTGFFKEHFARYFFH
jgi:serine/threonine protein kinase